MQEELLEENAISAITGATITTRAVRDSIKTGISKLQICIQEDKEEQEEQEKKENTE